VATSAVLEDTRHTGNATCNDFKSVASKFENGKEKQKFRSKENKKRRGKGHL